MENEGFKFKYYFDSDDEEKEYDASYDEMYSYCQKKLYSDGYKIYTSIDLTMQQQLQEWKNKKKWKCMAKTFKLVRHHDISGVSGTGIVAEGVTFDSGQTVIYWTRPPHTLSVYPSPEAVLDVHGHDGSTRIEWDETKA